jgi:hypothetical protein
MEARQKVGYIKFWLDAESFCAATKCLKLTPTEDTVSVPWAVTRDWLESSTGTDTASIASTEDGSLSPSVETVRPEVFILRNECNNVKVPEVSDGDEEIVICSRAASLSRDSLMDAIRIYQKYLSTNAPRKQAVQVPEEMRSSTVDQICKENGHVDSNCFTLAQQYVYEIMEKE